MTTQLLIQESDSQEQDLQQEQKVRISRGAALGLAGLAGASTATVIAVQPSYAAGLEDVSAIVTGLASIANAASAAVIVGLGVRLAIKMVNRVTVKG